MKIILILRAAMMVLTLGIASAYAGDGDGQSAVTLFTEVQAQQQAAIQARRHTNSTRLATTQNSGATAQANGARPAGVGASLFSVFSLP